jgi:preprotein translocase subunit SecF
MEFFKKTPTIPFMEKRFWAYAVSVILILGSLLLLLTRGLNFGIDFTGGVVIEVHYPNDVDRDRAEQVLDESGFADAQVTNIDTARDLMVRVLPRPDEDTNQLANRIV